MDDHLVALCKGCEAVLAMLGTLQDTDFVSELSKIVSVQQQILAGIIQGQHYGSAQLIAFVKYTNEIISIFCSTGDD